MRAVVQKVKKSSVTVDGRVTGAIGPGLMILLGVEQGDTEKDSKYLAEKIAVLRIFMDDDGKMNLSVIDTGGSALVVSQFTLLGDCRKGRRPSYAKAAQPEIARKLYRNFVDCLSSQNVPVQEGVFAAMMDVELINDGPVTLLLDSNRKF